MKRAQLLMTATMFTAATLLATTSAHALGTPSAQEFVTKASIANKFEIDSSELAVKKATRPDVKSFANQMIDDHSKAGEDMKAALSESESGAKPAANLDAKHQRQMTKLEKASGEDFDREYISMQKVAHKEAVNLFDKYADKGKDPALKNFAARTLPVLKGHNEHVKTLK